MSGTASGPRARRPAASRSRSGRPAGWPGSGSGWPAPRPQPRRSRQEEEAGEARAGRRTGQKKKPKPVRNVTDPDSALMPVRGGGLKQGYNCQDAAADDRLMLGGFASASAADTVHAARLEAVAVKGAQVVAAAHADPGHDVAACHARMCTAEDPGDPGHDATACHAQMTGTIGVIVFDAGYCSEANLTAGGSVDRLIATGNRLTMGKAAADNPASGPPPEDATAIQKMDHRLRTPAGPRRLQAPRPRHRGRARQHRGRHRAAPLLHARPRPWPPASSCSPGCATTCCCCPACPDPARPRKLPPQAAPARPETIHSPANRPPPGRTRATAARRGTWRSLTSRNEPRPRGKSQQALHLKF